MSIVPAGTQSRQIQAIGDAQSHDYVSIFIAGQMFGIPVLQVQDVLGPQRITRIPLAPPEVAGSLNLRGRIVTAIDVRTRLKLPKNTESKESMSVVVDQGGEQYSLLVDNVGEVLSLTSETFERNPATLDSAWRDVSNGIHRLDGNLLIILDVARLLDFATSADAA
ncbi:chemotaxis protein CheW [Aliidongia dinghuensis]|uniref:Chemotaxis protein CheW n=1 Tax=Aliidongia dinghuensis TaxID=1867774 RepID=A0A8J3E5F3_9PROT|nr:chemotaxis protein CheW [Aliidongia dinghuensis]GGF35338.1 chemotaxis protein CheW [Aliidongia dinghuensis]